MNLLVIGDVVGRDGRKAVVAMIPELRREFECDFVIVNAENIAAGSGMTAKCLHEFDGYADAVTSGDHVWDQKGFEHEISSLDNVLRPANLHRTQPGHGWKVFTSSSGVDIAVINLMGKVFMRDSAYCPFETAEDILRQIPDTVKNIVVDFHAEASSEKIAMGYFLDGKVTVVFGTHTHVQTADAKILPNGTAYITDVGMVGCAYSVIGRTVESVVDKFRSGMPRRLPVAEGPVRLDAAVVNFNPSDGRAVAIQNISRMFENNAKESAQS
ncbi:MAG: YmdB family metallophosphoesterase [Lentisphaerae bacterium]|jgi:metallophosphoesterase (TIGR00282 family)|nr:TIGR00282 family metallophosphoesterase [Victivallaceae bacterium]MDD5664159.1 TIGR00282 family metallophosphoesterase [Victivallaceae bacterium]NLK82822.1 YmdB family metallophosphoesterase [Lentisphaerota bacterium]